MLLSLMEDLGLSGKLFCQIFDGFISKCVSELGR